MKNKSQTKNLTKIDEIKTLYFKIYKTFDDNKSELF
jgi:hypothetical protein